MRNTLISLSILLLFPFLNLRSQNLENIFNDLSYRNVGPNRGGRVTAVAGIEDRPNEYYMGATGGGVWKTNNYGSSWENVSDGYFSTGSIGAIRVFQDNPDIVYVGTGSDGIRSNVIIGKGMYRSNDGGQSWVFIGLKQAGQIGAILIHPEDPDICYVAAIGNPFGPNDERGVYKTTDGGDTWDKVLYISNKTGAVDLEFSPDNPEIIYSSVWTVQRKPWTIISGSDEGGVYKSINGGKDWNKLGNGLPEGIIGKSDLAVCKAQPSYVYVLIEAEKGQNGLYFSDNYGEQFKLISNYPSLLDRPFYYCNVDVDPTNPDVIFVNSTGFHKSNNLGKNWNRVYTPHGDNHDMWINPSDPNIFIQSNDGGANVTRDGGKTWSLQNNQPTAELYQVNVDDQFPYWLYAGQQDNSTLAIPSNSSINSRRTNFISVGGCETGPAVPKPGNHNIVYSNCKGRFGTFNKITGVEKQYYVGAANMYGHNPKDLSYRFQRVAPIYVSPHNPDVVYHGSQFLHKTINDGVNWETISPDLTAFPIEGQVISGSPITRDITGEEFYSTIYSISESPLKEGILWVGANDGPVNLSRNGGESWQNVTPKDLPPGGRVQTVEASPHNPAKAYIAVYRFLLNDFRPYIYRTNDYGKSWKLLSDGGNGIPDNYPTRVIREDPNREGLLFVGTEFGMFISQDDGLSWSSFQYNLPIVPITDIKINQKDLVLSTMGRSFWIMDDISPLHGIISSTDDVYLFKPKTAYRSRATRGANIDYFLPGQSDDIKLEIFNNTGGLVASLNPPGEAGHNRVRWDLTYSESQTQESGRRGASGPKVVPGSFTIKLSVLDKELKESLLVKPDPNVIATGMTLDDYREQFDLSLKITLLQNQAREFQKKLKEEMNNTEQKLSKRPNSKRLGEKLKKMEDIKSLMETDSGPYPQPMLLSQISYLKSMISRADQKPGDYAYLRYEELKQSLNKIKESLEIIN